MYITHTTSDYKNQLESISIVNIDDSTWDLKYSVYLHYTHGSINLGFSEKDMQKLFASINAALLDTERQDHFVLCNE
jgi:hypothetical protein